MGKRVRIIFLATVSMVMVVIQLGGISRGGLKDPGLSEAEIRHRWKEFNDVKDSCQVRGAYPYKTCFEGSAHKYGVPLPLLVAVARGESNFDPGAKSVKECYGIMQIQWPGTARDLGIMRKSDLLDPCTNIHAGARYLSWLLERYDGDPYLAVAAYNYGPNAVSSQRVPEGARWYAAYIHRHLQSVLSEPYRDIGKALILRFTFYERAAEFVAYLEKRVKIIPFQVFKSQRYTYDVYIIYKTQKEQKEYLQCLMETTGIKPLNGGQL